MANISKLVDEILSKDFVEADKLFETIMAEKIVPGIDYTGTLINEQIARKNPDIFKSLLESPEVESELDDHIMDQHDPVEAEVSEDIPDPLPVDGHRDADRQDGEDEEVYEEYEDEDETD